MPRVIVWGGDRRGDAPILTGPVVKAALEIYRSFTESTPETADVRRETPMGIKPESGSVLKSAVHFSERKILYSNVHDVYYFLSRLSHVTQLSPLLIEEALKAWTDYKMLEVEA